MRPVYFKSFYIFLQTYSCVGRPCLGKKGIYSISNGPEVLSIAPFVHIAVGSFLCRNPRWRWLVQLERKDSILVDIWSYFLSSNEAKSSKF